MIHDSVSYDYLFTDGMDACVKPVLEMHADGAFETDSPPYAKGGFLVALSSRVVTEPYDPIRDMFPGNTKDGVNPKRAGCPPIDARFLYGCMRER